MVTIVVLLILASVSITVVFGDNGILQLAKEAGEKTNEAVGKDLNDIQSLTSEVNDLINPPTTISEAVKRQYVFRETTTLYGEDGNQIITIPAGFKVLTDTEDNNVEYEDPANPTVEDGIVIADTTGNEFVWVPVFAETPIYTKHDEQYVGQLYNFTDSTLTKMTYTVEDCHEPDTVKYDSEYLKILNLKNVNEFKKQLQNEFDNLVKSIDKYKGFYIGRYETGALSSENKNVTPLVQKEQIPGNANWYYQYVESKNLSLKNTDERVRNSVTSSMIWGCQWDAVMNWFFKGTDEEKGYVTNSTGWYKDEVGEDENQNSEHRTGVDLKKNGNVVNRVKNIYDMGGNSIEWTIEADGNEIRIVRGGDNNSDGSIYSASYRDGYNSPDINQYHNSSRSTLIINL